MTHFEPLQAWRYDPVKVDLEKTIAPPYDVISPSKQGLLYERSPHNCIRLILNREEPGDDPEHSRYERARSFFARWQADGVLVKDQRPSFYIYRQIYQDLESRTKRLRTAIMGRIKLEPFEKGIVIPHEKTLDKPKKDRRALLMATRTNFSPVFGLYERRDPALSAVIAQVTSSPADVRACDDEQVEHELWVVSDTSRIQTIQKGIAAQRVYIADGHHRYTTALHYAADMRKQAGASDSQILDSDFCLMALVAFDDPGLAVYPTHRLLDKKVPVDAAQLFKKLEDYFEVREAGRDKISQTLAAVSSNAVIGVSFPSGKSYLLTLKDIERAKKQMPPGKSDAWCRLDVNLLGHLIFTYALNFPESAWEGALSFTHSDREAFEAVDKGGVSAAFLLAPPRVSSLRDLGETQELMPQKSTYFYPKLASGFLFYQHQEGGRRNGS